MPNSDSTYTYLKIIPSDYDSLDQLNKTYNWIPNKVEVRPTPEIIEAKRKCLETIELKYVSCRDYILHTVFSLAVKTQIFSGKLYVDEEDQGVDSSKINALKKFAPNEFPYNIEHGNHYVMWYAFHPLERGDLSDDTISEDIKEHIEHLLGTSAFNFAWYINPKMTVPEIFHVQVFWTDYSSTIK